MVPSTKSGLRSDEAFPFLKHILECAVTYVNTIEQK
jgi:hypothetical protein